MFVIFSVRETLKSLHTKGCTFIRIGIKSYCFEFYKVLYKKNQWKLAEVLNVLSVLPSLRKHHLRAMNGNSCRAIFVTKIVDVWKGNRDKRIQNSSRNHTFLVFCKYMQIYIYIFIYIYIYIYIWHF